LMLAPGASDSLTVTTLITQTTVNTATWTAANSTGLYDDAIGDTIGMGVVQHDITEFNSTTSAGVVTLEMVFNGTISPPGSGNPDEVVGFLEIDRDSSALTGLPPISNIFCPAVPDMGMDFLIDLGSYNDVNDTLLLMLVDEFHTTLFPVGLVDANFGSNSFTVDIPLDMLSVYGVLDEEGIINFSTVVGTVAEPTDCAPDSVYLSSRLDVSASDSATVIQNTPTDVALTGFDASAPTAWLPVWLMVLALVVMVIPAVILRLSAGNASGSKKHR